MEPEVDPLLVQFLRERDAACLRCGYSLRGLTRGSCPECGDRLTLMVGLAEPRLAWFVAGVVGLGGGLGFSVLILAYFVVREGLGDGWARLMDIVPLVVSSLALGGLIWGWVAGRRRLGRLGTIARWAMAATTFALSTAAAIWFFAWVE